uniref:Uncharacterized protein n=1 Tax=Arundo donax TaxID=35708 RepID=A0A0A9A0H7_ARUDO
MQRLICHRNKLVGAWTKRHARLSAIKLEISNQIRCEQEQPQRRYSLPASTKRGSNESLWEFLYWWSSLFDISDE